MSPSRRRRRSRARRRCSAATSPRRAPDQLIQKAVDEFGQIDIIVNNAGYTRDNVAHKMTDDEFQAMLDIHTVVPFRILRAAAPHLREPAKQEKEEGTARSSARS